MDVDKPAVEPAAPIAAKTPCTVEAIVANTATEVAALIEAEPPAPVSASMAAAQEIAKNAKQQEKARAGVMTIRIPRLSTADPAKSGAANVTKSNKRPAFGEPILLSSARHQAAQAAPAYIRILPRGWALEGTRLTVPIYGQNKNFIYAVCIDMRTIAEYMRFSDAITVGGIHNGVGEVPVGYGEFTELLRRAKLGKRLCPINLETGEVIPIPDNERIERTFWVRQLANIRSESAAHKMMDELEGKRRELTDEERLLREASELEALQGRLANARRAKAIAAARLKKAEKGKKNGDHA